MVDLWRDFWIRETRRGQQVAQLHDRYMIMIMIIIIIIIMHYLGWGEFRHILTKG